MDCIFCKIASGDIPSQKVLEDDEFVAFHDINPKGPVHVLVVPRKHIESLNQIHLWEQGEGDRLLRFIAQVARQLGIAETGFRVVSNNGPDAGQEAPHLHFHVVGGAVLGDIA